MGGYAEYTFGKSGNFMANYTYGISLLIANVAIAISAVGYGAELFGVNLSPLVICIATIAVLWICTIANFGGAHITGQISSITVWGLLFPLWASPLLAGTGSKPTYISTPGTHTIFHFFRPLAPQLL